MPADVLSSLLNSGIKLEASGPGDASSTFETNPAMQQRDQQANYEAMMHYLRTGQEPAQMTNPTYGPIGKLLQTLGATSKYKPVSEGLSDTMWGLGQAKKDEDEVTRERKLELMQKQGIEFGTPSARTLGETLGAPELESAFPQDLKGMGELRMGAQELQIQKLLQSDELKQQQMGNQMLAIEMRAALAEGNADRYRMLDNIRQDTFNLKKTHEEMQPVAQYTQDMIGHLNHREELLTGLISKMETDPMVDPNNPAIQKYRDELERISKQRSAIFRGRSGFKTPADLDKALSAIDPGTGAPSTGGGPKPLKKGIFARGAD